MSVVSKNTEALKNEFCIVEKTIILNIGGIKYETYTSTLTAYPYTLLGVMFSQRNQSMLHPKNGNEYFFDRNGHAFRYIMEYHRTGKLLYSFNKDNKQQQRQGYQIVSGCPDHHYHHCCNNHRHVDGDFNAIVTKEELIEELLYFQIPFNNSDTDDHNRDNVININDNHAIANAQLGAQKLDSFIIAMIHMINEMKASFMQSVELKFPRQSNSIDSADKSLRLSNENLYHPVRFMQPYCFVGYVLLKNFETDIHKYIISKINGFHWEVERISGAARNKHLKVTVKIDINVKKRDVLANSSLGLLN